MTGRKVPATNSRAIIHMLYNEVFGKERKNKKRQARREDRRYLKEELRKQLDNLK